MTQTTTGKTQQTACTISSQHIHQHMNGKKFTSVNISSDKSDDKDIQTYNPLLPFVGIIANIDINLFKEFVDGVIRIYNEPIQTTEKLNNNSYNQIKNNIDDHNINQFNNNKKEKETEDNINEENKEEEKKEDLNNSKDTNINNNDKDIIGSKPQSSNDLDNSDKEKDSEYRSVEGIKNNQTTYNLGCIQNKWIGTPVNGDQNTFHCFCFDI